tara:strand:- start:696 stop:1619 length:924 start_codon:yes stop_codon:yes gene_type:complete
VVIRSLLKPKLWITLASLAFIAVALVHQGEQLRQINLEPRGWWLLLLGLGVTWLSILINGLAWRLLLDWLGQRPPGVALVPLFVRSNLLKYLPGGIWHLVERVRRLRPAIGAGPALAGVILDPLLIVAAASLLMLVGGWQHGLLLLLAPIPSLVLLLPRLREPVLRRLERTKAAQLQAAGSGDLPVDGSGRGGAPWLPLAAQMVFVLIRFAGFACCLAAFDLNTPAAGQWLAAFALAYAAGLVVPGAPGGLGVFEATLLLRLGVSVDEASLLAVVLSYRVISTLADLLAAAVLAADQALMQRLRPVP